MIPTIIFAGPALTFFSSSFSFWLDVLPPHLVIVVIERFLAYVASALAP